MKKNMLRIISVITLIFVGSSFFAFTEGVTNGNRQVTGEKSLVPCPLPFVPDTGLRIIHVYVALCDNDSQGIIPVPRKVGNGNDAANNIYWGGEFGMKTFFSQTDDWELLDSSKNISTEILQRCVWKHRRYNCYLVADAYKGARIKTCTMNFLLNASGHPSDTARFKRNGKPLSLMMENANLVCYVGHDGFMDFEIPNPPPQNSAGKKDMIILSSASKLYFKDAVLSAGGNPILWTTNILTPEAYTLKASIDGWLFYETGAEICVRAAKAYDFYNKCGYEHALNLFATGYY
jgi:hypothetical protein